MFAPNAAFPTAVLLLAVVLASKALRPTAVFEAPVVLTFKAS